MWKGCSATARHLALDLIDFATGPACFDRLYRLLHINSPSSQIALPGPATLESGGVMCHIGANVNPAFN